MMRRSMMRTMVTALALLVLVLGCAAKKHPAPVRSEPIIEEMAPPVAPATQPAVAEATTEPSTQPTVEVATTEPAVPAPVAPAPSVPAPAPVAAGAPPPAPVRVAPEGVAAPTT